MSCKYHKIWNDYFPNDPIRKGEVIHHMDNNRKNNRIENLKKMTVREHLKLHKFSEIGSRKLENWRKSHPEKFREMISKNGSKSAALINQRIKEDPDFEEHVRKRRIEGGMLRKGKTVNNHSPEMCKKQSESLTRFWENPENKKMMCAKMKEGWKKRGNRIREIMEKEKTLKPPNIDTL